MAAPKKEVKPTWDDANAITLPFPELEKKFLPETYDQVTFVLHSLFLQVKIIS